MDDKTIQPASTKGLPLYLSEEWKAALDDENCVKVLFVDFKEAFDSVNSDILKRLLQAVGIFGDMFHWICDYLDARKQLAEVDRKFLSVDGIGSGVPYGSLIVPVYSRFLSMISLIPHRRDISLCMLMAQQFIVFPKPSRL